MATPSRRARINLVADFETTTTPERSRVWLWGLGSVDEPVYENVQVGTDIDAFIAQCQRQNANVYFHNLRFDGNFILYYLLTHGYTHNDTKQKTAPGEFKTLIDGRGIWFSVTVVWTNGKTTEFRDSYKKLPMDLASVARSFKLPVTKGELDYEKDRPIGYEPTREEIDYQIRDVLVIAYALKMQFEQGLSKLTVASDALSEFKNVFGVKKFERVFPVLPVQLDAELRHAYRGGWTYADDRTMGCVVGPGVVFDVNSLYPSVMYFSLLPYGEPTYFRGDFVATDSRPLGIFSVTFTAKIKADHVPCIQIKGNSMFTNTEYLKRIKEPTTLWVTSVDWELWNEHYDIEVLSYNGGWAFKAAHGFFDEYIDKWSEIKATSTGGLREIAKLMLNSLYGKFAKNPNTTSKIPYLKDDHVAFELGAEETGNPIYTAMGAFITAYARATTIRAAQASYGSFMYADTDSLHLAGIDLPPLDIHPSKLGAWKIELAFGAAMYVRAKFYLEQTPTGEYENHVAGLPRHVADALEFEDITPGKVIDREWYFAKTGNGGSAKMRPVSVPGGIVLEDTSFTIKM